MVAFRSPHRMNTLLARKRICSVWVFTGANVKSKLNQETFILNFVSAVFRVSIQKIIFALH
jgi:hypothetical protein